MERNWIRGLSSKSMSRSVRSTGSGGSSLCEIEEEPAETSTQYEEDEEEEKVYFAVTKELRESKSNLLWTLQNTKREKKKLALVHVHRPSQLIPMMGAPFPASELDEQYVKAYRHTEREKLNKSLNKFLTICSQQTQVSAEKLVIEMDDIGEGLVELIALHGITKLVIGAAADNHYSKKMRVPRSKTAITVQQQADPSCKIWFICKGNLICTRESGVEGFGIVQSATSSTSSTSSRSEHLKSRSLPQGQGESLNCHTNGTQGFFRRRSKSVNFESHGGGIAAELPQNDLVDTSTPQSRLRTDGSNLDNWEVVSRTSHGFEPLSCSMSDEVLSSSTLGSLSTPKDEECEEGSVVLDSLHESEEDLQFSSPHDESEDLGVIDEVCDKLKQAHTEVKNSKREAYEESLRRQNAVRDLVKALQKVKTSEILYRKERKQREDIEETLARGKLEFEELKNQRDEAFEELRRTQDQKSVLELRIADCDHIIKELEEKQSASQPLLISLQREYEALQRERDDVLKEAEELRRKKEEVTMSSHHGPMNLSDFSYSELVQATRNFHDSLKIGEGGFGSVYKGFLRHTMVAIKKLNPEGRQGQLEFHQEVDVLSRVRHPNLITLIGGCSEACALIYEFLPNGSLEDRLVCKENTPPLTWQVRTRIAAEVCSALIFLHSNKPHIVVHGDLKPANILLDANFVSKLGDFGICRLLLHSNTSGATPYWQTDPKGSLMYIDPEFQNTGELTPYSDVYAFGVVILRLLTGKPALGVVRGVQEAREKGNLHRVFDVSAGKWPFAQAIQLVHLGLRCCEMEGRRRPHLSEVWSVLEFMTKAAMSSPEDNTPFRHTSSFQY